MSSHHLPHANLYIWTAVITVVLVCSGLLSIGGGLGIDTGLPLAPDIGGGCILLLLGAILGTGLVEGNADRARFVQFGYAGLLLLLIFGVCTVIIFAAQALSLVLEGQAADWIPLTGSGFIWASIIALPLFPRIKKILFGCSQGECCCE